MSKSPQTAPEKPAGTHFLLKKEIVEAVYNYLGTRPASEVIKLMTAMESGAESVSVGAPVVAPPAVTPAPEEKDASQSKEA